MRELHRALFHHGVAQPSAQGVRDQPHERHPFVERGLAGALDHALLGGAFQYALDLIVGAVLREQVVVYREALRDLGVLHVLPDQQLVHGDALLLVQLHHGGEVVPAARRDERLAVHGGLHAVEVVALDIEVREHGGVHARLHGEVAPGGEIGLHVDALEAVPGGDVEIVRRAVVLGRVAGRNHDPPVGHAVASEDLVLQKLQHRGRQRFRHAVDLVEEQDALALAGGLHRVVHGGDDLAHRVFGHVVFHAVVRLLRDERQAERALARVVRNRIRHEPHVEVLGDLLHDGRLPDAGRAQQEHGALPFGGQTVVAELVLRKVRQHGVFDLLLCLTDVHDCSPCELMS